MKRAALRLLLTVGCCPLLAAGTVQAAPIVLTDASGYAIGIDDLIYAGTDYNVSLRTGTCADAFGTCDQSHFGFVDQIDAMGAEIAVSSALYNRFLNQRDPDRNQFSAAVPALLMTPFDVDFSNGMVISAATVMSQIPDNEFRWLWSLTADAAAYTSGSPKGAKGTWVVFTQVPEPSSWLLLGLGCAALLIVAKGPNSKADAQNI
jgi:hypothetical protein